MAHINVQCEVYEEAEPTILEIQTPRLVDAVICPYCAYMTLESRDKISTYSKSKFCPVCGKRFKRNSELRSLN